MNGKVSEKRVVGAKQTIKAVKTGMAKIVYVAKDADEKVLIPIKALCKSMNVEIVYLESMKELGKLCGIDVGAATACVIKN